MVCVSEWVIVVLCQMSTDVDDVRFVLDQHAYVDFW